MDQSRSSLSTNENLETAILESTGALGTTQRGPHHWRHRIGRWGLLIILLGTLALVLGVGLLAFIWHGAWRSLNGDEPPLLWNNITSTGWATRWVTICSVAIRTAIAAQLGLATAMVASLVLETSGTSLAEAPLLSIARASNSEPYVIFWALARHANGVQGLAYLGVLSFAVGILVVSQFTSTILLSDFAMADLPGIKRPSVLAIARKPEASDILFYPPFGYDSLRSSPAANWRFAESSSPPLVGSGFVDTGIAYRAFLPFTNETERTTLLSYEGLAPVTETRVVCSRPTFLNLSVAPSDEQGRLEVGGSLRLDDSFPVERSLFANTTASEGLNFWCVLASNFTLVARGYDLLSLCRTNLFVRTQGSAGNSTYSVGTLIFNATGTTSSVELSGTAGNASTPGGHLSPGNAAWIFRNDGPWTSAAVGSKAAVFSATLCYGSVFSPQNYNVSMFATQGSREPLLGWLTSTKDYDTTAVRSQLGAGSSYKSIADRGVLSLNFSLPTVSPSVDADAIPWDQLPEYQTRVPDNLRDPLNSLILVPPSIAADRSGSANIPHVAHSTVFRDTLRATRNPALALQGLYTRLAQMGYYEWAYMYDVSASVVTAHSTMELVPGRWMGFSGVVACCFLHFVLVGLCVVLFVRHTSWSLLGGAWMAVAQVAGGEAEAVAKQVSGLRDGEVRERLQGTDLDKEVVEDMNGRGELRLRRIGGLRTWKRDGQATVRIVHGRVELLSK